MKCFSQIWNGVSVKHKNSLHYSPKKSPDSLGQSPLPTHFNLWPTNIQSPRFFYNYGSLLFIEKNWLILCNSLRHVLLYLFVHHVVPMPHLFFSHYFLSLLSPKYQVPRISSLPTFFWHPSICNYSRQNLVKLTMKALVTASSSGPGFPNQGCLHPQGVQDSIPGCVSRAGFIGGFKKAIVLDTLR